MNVSVCVLCCVKRLHILSRRKCIARRLSNLGSFTFAIFIKYKRYIDEVCVCVNAYCYYTPMLCFFFCDICVALQHWRCHLIWEVHLCVILQWLMSPLFSICLVPCFAFVALFYWCCSILLHLLQRISFARSALSDHTILFSNLNLWSKTDTEKIAFSVCFVCFFVSFVVFRWCLVWFISI